MRSVPLNKKAAFLLFLDRHNLLNSYVIRMSVFVLSTSSRVAFSGVELFWILADFSLCHLVPPAIHISLV